MGYKDKEVIEGASFAIASGSLACLIGPNGAGKSTLLKTIAGFQKPLSGSLYLQGKNADNITSSERSSLLSVVLTRRPDVENLTTAELVGLGRTPYTNFWGTLTAADKSIVDRSMRQVGILSLAARTVSTLSDGECQKAMTAKALAQQTPIILLDEPTAFLDYPSKVAMMRLLKKLTTNQGKTIIVSTHDLELALGFADTLLYIEGGRLAEITHRQLADYIADITQRGGERP